MADRGVSRHGLDRVDGPLVRSPDQRTLRAAVLIAERNLQVEDLFAVALEAEMPRLNNPGMNRTDCDLVNLLASDSVKVGDADNRVLSLGPTPGIMTGSPRALKADRLEPGVSFRPHAELLGDLALEEMDLRAVRRQRGECVRLQTGPGHVQQGVLVIR